MTSRHIKKYIAAALPLLLAGCADEDLNLGTNPANGEGKVSIFAEINQVNLTRANDTGFADGDRIGVFAVNDGTLEATDNWADNVMYTYNEAYGTWTGSKTIYHPQDGSTLDFYAYYPYVPSFDDTAYDFSVRAKQHLAEDGSSIGGYEASDFLWGTVKGVGATVSSVNIRMGHILSCVSVILEEGTGFEAGEWAGIDKTVAVENTRPDAVINLRDGSAKVASGSEKITIFANPDKTSYRAIVVPQSVASDETILNLTIDGRNYTFSRNSVTTFEPGHMHKFTMRVNKKGASGDYEVKLVEESITAWENDLTSHNGEAREYITVNSEAGHLAEAIAAAGLTPSEVRNLKITGSINGRDYAYMRENMPTLEAINLKDVKSIGDDFMAGGKNYSGDYGIPNGAFQGMTYLTWITFPDKLVRIGDLAFRNTNISGSLVLPEGLIAIGGSAFSNWEDYTTSNLNLTGQLALPSTVVEIGGSAFENCNFSGELILPEGLKKIGGSAFRNCRNFSGELHLPESLTEIGDGAFENMVGLRGRFVLPRNLKRIPTMQGINVSELVFSDEPIEIAQDAFRDVPLRGTINVPKSVSKIGNAAFRNTKISHINLPEGITMIPDELCLGAEQLADTLNIPKNVEIIGTGAFSGCRMLNAAVLPKSVQSIHAWAFENCHALTYLRCEAVTPPEVSDAAFNGVEKNNFTLEVPEGSVDAYRSHPVWGEFKRIAVYRNFVARPSKYNVLNRGGTRTVILNADADWEMTSCPSWCHVSKTSGYKKTELTLTVDAMAHSSADRTGKITFTLKGDKEYTTTIDVRQYDYEYDEDSALILNKATKGKGVDIVFCGDGYDAADIAGGLYLQDMKQEMEYFFGVEPYTTYRDYFNVYTLIARSEESGVEMLNTWRETKFQIRIGDGKTRLSAANEMAVNYAARNVPSIGSQADPKFGVVLVANCDVYEGVTYVMGNHFCAVVTKSADPYPMDARGLVQHEAGGHGVGWLADEYVYHSNSILRCPCTCCEHAEGLRQQQSIGFGLNVSLDGKYRSVPWSHLIFHKNYGDIVDIYEGGYFHQRSVFRSEYNSCMNNNIPYYSAWQRELIVRRIMKLSGETFSFDDFVAKDKRTMGSASTRAWAGTSLSRHHGNPPIIQRNFKLSRKKGGRR